MFKIKKLNTKQTFLIIDKKMIKNSISLIGKENKMIKFSVNHYNNLKKAKNINSIAFIKNKLQIINITHIIFFSIIFFSIICLNKQIYSLTNLNFNYEIILTIKGTGNQIILNKTDFGFLPNSISVNGQEQYPPDFIAYNLTKEENIIILTFNKSLTNFHKMFSYVSNLTKIDFSNFDSSLITNMSYMFNHCKNLMSINFNNFIASSVIDMTAMLYDCGNLASLDLSYFNASNVVSMKAIFYKCSSLISLNISSFNTSRVNDMSYMFYRCYNLTYLDLSHFNVLNVVNTSYMFSYCYNLTSINLSNFITSSVTDMIYMFRNCSNLISLDLSYFNTSNVISMYGMFRDCSNLLSINLGSFITSSVKDMTGLFYGCSNLISLDLSNFDTSKANINLIFSLINNDIIFCNNRTEHTNLNDLMKNYTNNCSHICFKNQKKIVENEKKCILNCYDDINYNYEYNNMCYEKCPEGTIDISNSYKCEIFRNDSNNEQIDIIEKQNVDIGTEIISNSYLFNNDNYISHVTNIITTDKITDNNNILNFSEKMSQDNIFKENINLENQYNLTNQKLIDFIRNMILNRTIIYSDIIDKNNNLLIKENNNIYEITTLDKLKNNGNNISKINLDNCENKLKTIYNIDRNLSLILFKIDYYIEGLLIPFIGYELFHSLNNSLLDLNYCSNETSNITIPVEINEEEVYKYDPNSEYYTDDCSPYTTNNGTDILLIDRQNEFIDNNMSLCENNCSFEKYDEKEKIVVCKCLIKKKQIILSEVLNNTNILNNEFSNNSPNTVTMKCYYVLFTKEGIVNNIESYILIFIITIFISLSILFYKCGYQFLIDEMSEIILLKEGGKNNNYNIYDTKDEGEKNLGPKNNKQNKNKEKIITFKKRKKVKKKKKGVIKIKGKNNSSKIETKEFSNIGLKINFNNNPNLKSNESNENSMNFIDYELNNFSYENALKYDKRTHIKYYFSLVKSKHPLIFIFILSDYNSKIIKLSIFLLFFSIIYTTNTVFFNEDIIHQIYKEGFYNIVNLLPQMTYSFIISHSLFLIIKHIFLSERNIIEIKHEKDLKNVNDKMLDLKKCLAIKYVCFYVFGTIILIFVWYYLSTFGAVFQNSQKHLIKNIFVSLALSFIYPFIINLLPCIFRFLSLKDEKSQRKSLYNFSKIIQFI